MSNTSEQLNTEFRVTTSGAVPTNINAVAVQSESFLPEAIEASTEEEALIRETEIVGEILSEAAEEASTVREKAAVMAGLADTPRLAESGFAPEVLEKLLPDEEVIILPKVSKISGGFPYRFIKRSFDIISCSAALFICAIPMAIIAIKIKHESEGPVFYAQRRVGKDGKVFKLYKFRSMYIDAEARGAQWAAEEDPRITPLGKKLRKSRLAPVIIGTPGGGEPTKSLSHPVNSSLDLQECERRPEVVLGACSHYISLSFLSATVFRGLTGVLERVSRIRAAVSDGRVCAVARSACAAAPLVKDWTVVA